MCTQTLDRLHSIRELCNKHAVYPPSFLTVSSARSPSLTESLLILISLPAKGEFIPNCARGRSFNLFVERPRRRLYDNKLSDGHSRVLLQCKEYCYSVGKGKAGRLYLRGRCTKSLHTTNKYVQQAPRYCCPFAITVICLRCVSVTPVWPSSPKITDHTTSFVFVYPRTPMRSVNVYHQK